MDDMTWPNSEKLAVSWIKAATSRPVFTETPEDLQPHLPAYQVNRVGGTEISPHERTVILEIDVMAATRAAMWDSVQVLQRAMGSLAANGTAQWYVDDVVESFGAAIEPTQTDGIRRATSTYTLTLRPTS